MNFGRAGDGAVPERSQAAGLLAIAMRLARRMAKARSGTTSEMVSIGPGMRRGGRPRRIARARRISWAWTPGRG